MRGTFRKNADNPAIFSARDYEGLRRLIDARRVELKVKMLDVDVDAGLQSGYFAKLTCGMRNYGPKTLGPVLESLGVEIALIPASGWHREEMPQKTLQFAHITRLKNNAPLAGRLR